MLSCCECGEVKDSEPLLAAHISIEHLTWLPYSCMYCLTAGGCSTRKASEQELREHLRARHPIKQISILFTPDEHKEKLLRDKIERSKALSNKNAQQAENEAAAARKIKLETMAEVDGDDDFIPDVPITPATSRMNVGRKTYFMPAHELMPMLEAGDIIETAMISSAKVKAPASWACHMAVYVGKGGVVHVTGENMKSTRIREDGFIDYFGERLVRINNSLDEKHPPRSPEQIVEAARELVGKVWDYRLLVNSNNCQNFACKIRNNLPYSHNAEETKKAAKMSLLFVLSSILISAVVKAFREDTDDEDDEK